MARPKKEVNPDCPPGYVGLTINWLGQGENRIYACGGFHVADEHKCFLPNGKKLKPGEVMYLPPDVAEEYRCHECLRPA